MKTKIYYEYDLGPALIVSRRRTSKSQKEAEVPTTIAERYFVLQELFDDAECDLREAAGLE